MLGDDLGSASEIFSFQQVVHSLFPCRSIQEVFREASVFSRDAHQPRFGAHAASQKTLKQWMQAVFFAASIAGDGHEDVAVHQRGQHGSRNNRWEKPGTAL